jgi:cysteinyl-tRNA synthetase
VIEKGYEPLDYRYFLLGGHYRSQLTFSWESMDSAKNSRRSLVQRIAKVLEAAGPVAGAAATPAAATSVAATTVAASPASAWIDRFREHISQDLNTPRALSELQGLVKDATITPREIITAIETMDTVLGLDLLASARATIDVQNSHASAGIGTDPRIDALVAERIESKKAKNFARADEIRNQLKAEGIILEDGPAGTLWRRA